MSPREKAKRRRLDQAPAPEVLDVFSDDLVGTLVPRGHKNEEEDAKPSRDGGGGWAR